MEKEIEEKKKSKIFTARKAFKPFEYPEILKYSKAIQSAYWTVDNRNFSSDIQDFKTSLTEKEQTAVKRAILCVSQIEVEIKEFWSKLGDRFPKSEFKKVAAVFSESEERHESAYSHLLEVLNLNDEFMDLVQVPAIEGRLNYLTKYLKGATPSNDQNFTMNLALFTIYMEYVSLFSQFAILKAFNKNKKVLKSIDVVISETFREETLHSLLGIYLINKIKEENPEWFDEDFYEKIYRASKKAYEAENKILDFILEKGELDFLSKESVQEFIKFRLNEAIVMIGGKPIFEVDKEKLKNLDWFIEEIIGEISVDFFYKKSADYSQRLQAYTEDDLF